MLRISLRVRSKRQSISWLWPEPAIEYAILTCMAVTGTSARKYRQSGEHTAIRSSMIVWFVDGRRYKEVALEPKQKLEPTASVAVPATSLDYTPRADSFQHSRGRWLP